jgi:hypothetical protein
MSTTLLCRLYVFPSVTPVCFASCFLVCSLLLPLLSLPIPPLCPTAYLHDFYAESQFKPSGLTSCFAPWYCLFFLCLSIPLLASKYVPHFSTNYMSFHPLPSSTLLPAFCFVPCSCLCSLWPIPPFPIAYLHDFYAKSRFNPSVLAPCFAPWYCLFFLCLSIPLLASKYVQNTSQPIICLSIRYPCLLCFPLPGLLSVVAFTLPVDSSLSNSIFPWLLCRISIQSVRSRFLLCSLILPFLPLPKYTSPCIKICPQHFSADYMSLNPLLPSALLPAFWFALCCCLYSAFQFLSVQQNMSMISMPNLVSECPFSLPALLPDTAFSFSA